MTHLAEPEEVRNHCSQTSVEFIYRNDAFFPFLCISEYRSREQQCGISWVQQQQLHSRGSSSAKRKRQKQDTSLQSSLSLNTTDLNCCGNKMKTSFLNVELRSNLVRSLCSILVRSICSILVCALRSILVMKFALYW